MSASLTADTINQGLSYGALAAVIAGVPPEVALGSLAGAVILLPLLLSIRSSAAFSGAAQLSLRSSLLQTHSINPYRRGQHDPHHHTGLVRAGYCLLRRRVRCGNCRGAGRDMAVSPL